METKIEQPQASVNPNPRSMPAPPVPEKTEKGGWWRPVVLLALVIAILVLAGSWASPTSWGTCGTGSRILGPWGPGVHPDLRGGGGGGRPGGAHLGGRGRPVRLGVGGHRD